MGTGDLFPARINQELKNSRRMQECAVSTNKVDESPEGAQHTSPGQRPGEWAKK
jgi:hypothetical protein